MADKPHQSAEEAFLKSVWGKRKSGVPMKNVDWGRPISHEDVQFLLKRYPFLQILSVEPELDPSYQTQFIRAESGWIIHDYGCALSSSPGEFLFGGGYWIHTGWDLPVKDDKTSNEDAREESNPIINPGKGTIVKQSFDTATDMVEVAVQKGWPGIQIISGDELMKWAVWMRAEDYGLPLIGFTPSERDRERRERVVRELGLAPVAKPTLRR